MSSAAGLVTTIVPVFNRPTLVPEAVASIVAQSHRPIEILIVDDGSTDSTPHVCEDLASKHPEVSVIHAPHGGPGPAREAGRLRAQGQFIQYLDSDDILYPLKFERQILALSREPNTGVAYCRTREYFMEEPERWWSTQESDVPLATLFPRILSHRPWRTPSPLFCRWVSDAVGPWADIVQEEDWEYDARVAALGVKLAWCPEFLADLRHHHGTRAGGGSLSNPVRMHARYEAHRLIYAHARTFGVPREDSNMARFARELFLLARQCGATGLPEESRHLFDLAREASVPERARGLDFRLYRLTAKVLGWSLAGRLACWSDRLRPRRGDRGEDRVSP